MTAHLKKNGHIPCILLSFLWRSWDKTIWEELVSKCSLSCSSSSPQILISAQTFWLSTVRSLSLFHLHTQLFLYLCWSLTGPRVNCPQDLYPILVVSCVLITQLVPLLLKYSDPSSTCVSFRPIFLLSRLLFRELGNVRSKYDWVIAVFCIYMRRLHESCLAKS